MVDKAKLSKILKQENFTTTYEKLDEIGRGTYSTIYKVKNKITGVERAMKVIPKADVEQAVVENEIEIQSDMDHPNIVKLLEAFETDRDYFLIVEYCSGGELFDRVLEVGYLTEKVAADYMKQLLSALAYLHEKNIAHRDLKPEELVLTTKDEDANFKVIDFGLANKFQPGTVMTKTVGSPYYIAPEVINKCYTEKCDIWSSGTICYILLCGYPPFYGYDDKEILENVRKGDFAFPEEEWSGISNEAKNLIKKMLTKDPAKRISAKEALNDPWIKKNAKTQQINPTAFKNLSEFSSKNKVKQAVLTLLATQMLSQEERDGLEKIFKAIDKDGNGELTHEELIEGYKEVFKNNKDAEKQAKAIIEKADLDNSGRIDFTEFIIAACDKEKLYAKEKLDRAFKMIDTDNSGYLTRDEISSIMNGVIDDEQWKKIIEEVDKNGDGKISQDEFVDLIFRVK